MSKYGDKLSTAEAVAALVRDSMWIDYGAIQSPRAFDRALAQRIGKLKNIKVRCIGHLTPPQVMEKDPEAKSCWWGNWHILGLTRKFVAENRGQYIPQNFGETPRAYREDIDVDMAVITTTPMDKHGYFNFGLQNTFTRATLEKAKIKVVEVNESMPWIYGGYDECIHISEVDYVLENKDDKIIAIPPPPATDTDRKIAEIIADMIPKDGPCLQIGIGGLPDTILRLLSAHGVRDIGIHSEMATEAVAELVDAGLITGNKKTFMPGKIVMTFAIGSRKLYDWLDHNVVIASYPVDFTNDPNVIALQKNLISINACLGVDLQGQVSSESVGITEYSGTGGQLAFVRGAYYRSPRGLPPFGYSENKSILALYSTYADKDGNLKSKITPTLPSGEIVTVPRVDVSYLVTEYGVAYLKGLSIPERVLAIAKIAHPNFRAWLIEEAGKMKWLNRQWVPGGIPGEKA
jgi:acyl-CoA hydrolase